jgi:hypothetical protein
MDAIELKIDTTKQDFERYRAHIAYWIKKCSLTNYQWFVAIEDINRDATVGVNWKGRRLDFAIAKEREGKFSIPSLARHEVFEALIGEMSCRLGEFLAEDIIVTITHDIIHRLQEIIPLPSDKEAGYVKK